MLVFDRVTQLTFRALEVDLLSKRVKTNQTKRIKKHRSGPQNFKSMLKTKFKLLKSHGWLKQNKQNSHKIPSKIQRKETTNPMVFFPTFFPWFSESPKPSFRGLFPRSIQVTSVSVGRVSLV